MEVKTNFIEFERQVHQKQFERILEEFKRVDEYVSKNFSDIEWSVEFNDDSGNPALPSFKIKPRLFTGVDMSKGDRLLLNKQLEIKITPTVWNDPMLMEKFIQTIYPMFTESITKEVNAWYQKRKQLTEQIH